MLALHPATVDAAQINVALGNPVVQSTNGFGFDGSLAVDGDRTGNSISHTDSGDLAPFLEVDLGESFPIENINVATRDNCCTPENAERDYNILVEVRSASDAILYSSPILNPWDGTGNGATDLGIGFVFELDLTGVPGGAVTGQKIRVSKTQAFGGSEWLHVAELEALVDDNAAPIVSLTVARDSGALTWKNNTGADIDVLGYSLTSATGAFDQTGWIPVAGNYDAPSNGGDGSVDADDPWTVLTAAGAHTDLSESELVGGDGGSIQNGQRVDLGSGVWIKNPTEDVAMQILRTDGTINDVTVVFDGNGGQPFQRSDLNFDGTIDEADWTVYLTGLEVDLSGQSPALAYQMGDLDYDAVNSVNDFAIFKGDFNAANGPGAFAAMIASVPEPSSVALLALGGLLLLVGSGRRAARRRGLQIGRLAAPAIAAGSGALIGILVVAAQGQAQDVNVALGQPVIQSTDGFGFDGTLAVDGIRTGNSISHTDSGDMTPFMEVDLGQVTLIDRINVVTRDNCCTPGQPERDYNVLVEIRDASDTVVYGSSLLNPWDGTGGGAIDLGNGFVFELDLTGEPLPVSGQKVRVTKTATSTGSEWLHVAELEVFTGLENVPRLGLTVGVVTGEISLVNRFDTDFTADYYRISSATDSLDPSEWDSLDQQDFDTLGPGIGASWDEAAGADAGLLAEAFLKGSSTFAAGATVNLGTAYARNVNSQDLMFEYRDPSSGDVLQGFVEYITGGVLHGDVNLDTVVNGLDVDPFVDVLLNGPFQAEADMNRDGVVNGLDVDPFVAAVVGGGVQAVPEPSTLVLLLLAGLVLKVGRSVIPSARAA